MLTFKPFRAGHLRYLAPQVLQRYEHTVLLNTEYASIVENNFGLSAWKENVCVGAAGAVEIFSHRAVGWAILSNDAAPYMLQITKKCREVMQGLPYKRIEITVRHDFIDGQRFARLLGAQLETPEPLRYHGATGEDEYMYAVTK